MPAQLEGFLEAALRRCLARGSRLGGRDLERGPISTSRSVPPVATALEDSSAPAYDRQLAARPRSGSRLRHRTIVRTIARAGFVCRRVAPLPRSASVGELSAPLLTWVTSGACFFFRTGAGLLWQSVFHLACSMVLDVVETASSHGGRCSSRCPLRSESSGLLCARIGYFMNGMARNGSWESCLPIS